MILFNSKNQANLSQWQLVTDVVMGGKSQSRFLANKEGFAEFSGQVSLENNGGFASVKYHMEPMQVAAFSKMYIKVKGDGNRYQFRLKTSKKDTHSYISYFKTTGKWQTLEFQLADFYPTYRGRTLKLPNFPGKLLEEIGFLIANKKTQDFKLEIAQVWLD